MAKKKSTAKTENEAGTQGSNQKDSKPAAARKGSKAAKKARRNPAKSDGKKASTKSKKESGGSNSRHCVVVGIGASAGGLEAFRIFLEATPADTGLAFVLIQHLDPDYESMMADLLSKYTSMPVVQAEDAMAIEPNHVYMIPPNRFIKLHEGGLFLDAPIKQRGMRMPIDYFFRSLAEHRQERAVGIVLSGTGSDGTQGIREIKAQGGMVMVQKPESAQYDGMPRSATSTGVVDFVLPLQDMPKTLVRYVQHPYLDQTTGEPTFLETAPDHYRSILNLLRAHTDYDFRCYKKGTLGRRIQRRMGLRHVESISDYLKLLRDDRDEISLLFKDLLISVTAFFREKDAWAVLENEVVAGLVAKKGSDQSVRVWVPGCATGEEAYSHAILFYEQFRLQGKNPDLQIFATDLDADAIDYARQGLYPESAAADIAPARVKNFFHKEEDRYRVHKRLREASVFAVQNLIGDPPFSNLDLISCRNLMIYLEPDIQQKMMRMFHFALRDGGVLFLGGSESINKSDRLFEPISQQWRIYRKIGKSKRGAVNFPIIPALDRAEGAAAAEEADHEQPFGAVELAKKVMLEKFAPATVLVNRKYQVQYFHGSLRDYLDIPTGEPTIDLAMMCLEGLRSKLRAVMHEAMHEGKAASATAPRVKRNGDLVSVKISVQPLPHRRGSDPMLLVSFEDEAKRKSHSESRKGESESSRRRTGEKKGKRAEGDGSPAEDEGAMRQLEYELQATREDLQSTIEELETSNEELKASNEEVMSMNEELQSTNEELETSREELQSLNEELSTVNSQLEEKVHELEDTNNDLSNLLSSTEIATIFLDTDFRIRRFTPATSDLLHVIPGDVGRPISDLAPRFNDSELYRDARTVLKKLSPIEREVWVGKNGEPVADDDEASSEGDDAPKTTRRRPDKEERRWFIRRILPYRTSEDKIDGVVITFADVSKLKKAAQRIARRERQTAVVAQLGHAALAGESLQSLLDQAAEQAAEALGNEFCKVLELLPNGKEFLLRAGVGWKEGLVGNKAVGAGLESQAGYTLQMGGPVITEDLNQDKRFSGPQLLRDHGIVSGLSVVIGPQDRPWGVLGTHSSQTVKFTVDDAHFIQAVANILWEAIQRGRAEQSLRDSEELVRTIAENSTQALVMMDAQGYCTYANEALLEMTGYSAEEIRSKPLHELVHHHHPDGREYPAVECPIDRALPEGTDLRNHEDWFFRKDGSCFPVVCAASPIKNGEPGGSTVLEVRDVTEQREAERNLRENEERLQLAKEAASLGIHDYDPQAQTVKWDQRIRDIWGVDPEESITYETFASGLHPDDRQATQEALDRGLDPAGDGKFYAEYRVINRKSGDLRWVAATGNTDFEDGKAVRLVGTVQDISERKRTEEKLQRADRRKDEFLATLAHEIRNPLAPIRTGLEMIEATEEDPASIRQAREMMERQTDQLIALVDDLTNVSRITRGKLELRKRRVDLIEAVRGAIEANGDDLREAGHQLELDLPDEPVYLEADPNRLVQVVSNLLDNAVKYTPDGGRIRLAVEPAGDEVAISIEDSGVGFPEGTSERLFDMFVQLEKRVPGRPEGLGIGLTLVKSLVEMHGGEIEAFSKGASQGSKFRVRLPVSTNSEEDKTESRPPRKVQAGKKKGRVLIVDDNHAAAQLLGMGLERGGHEVQTANGGARGVDLAQEFRPEVILLDLGMPEVDGFEVARRIRKQPWGKAILLVALTGWGQDGDKERTKAAGFDHHLVKPVRLAEIENLIAAMEGSSEDVATTEAS